MTFQLIMISINLFSSTNYISSLSDIYMYVCVLFYIYKCVFFFLPTNIAFYYRICIKCIVCIKFKHTLLNCLHCLYKVCFQTHSSTAVCCSHTSVFFFCLSSYCLPDSYFFLVHFTSVRIII